jgi:hypothetical protein
MEVYSRWAIAAGGLHAGVIILLSYAFGEGQCSSSTSSSSSSSSLSPGISVLSSYWLSYWSAHRSEHSAWFYLGIYVAISFGILISSTARSIASLAPPYLTLRREFYVAIVGWRAGGHLFAGMVVSVLHAPMSFFG